MLLSEMAILAVDDYSSRLQLVPTSTMPSLHRIGHNHQVGVLGELLLLLLQVLTIPEHVKEPQYKSEED